MEFIVEFILDICFEAGLAAGKSKRIPRTVRVLCLLGVSLVSLSVLAAMIYLGVLLMDENTAVGIIIIFVAVFIVLCGVYKSVKTYKRMRKENQMKNKPIFTLGEKNVLSITNEYVFRADFNDTYWLSEKELELSALDREELTWIDVYDGRSKNETKVAVLRSSDTELVILEKSGNNINEIKSDSFGQCTLCEDYDESMMLSARIKLKTKK